MRYIGSKDAKEQAKKAKATAKPKKPKAKATDGSSPSKQSCETNKGDNYYRMEGALFMSGTVGRGWARETDYFNRGFTGRRSAGALCVRHQTAKLPRCAELSESSGSMFVARGPRLFGGRRPRPSRPRRRRPRPETRGAGPGTGTWPEQAELSSGKLASYFVAFGGCLLCQCAFRWSRYCGSEATAAASAAGRAGAGAESAVCEL